jgi:hypothetical protein
MESLSADSPAQISSSDQPPGASRSFLSGAAAGKSQFLRPFADRHHWTRSFAFLRFVLRCLYLSDTMVLYQAHYPACL